MALLRLIKHRYVAGGVAAVSIAFFGLTATATAQSVPQRVANPYYAASPAVANPPATSAANSAVTLAEPHVVYPASTTNVVNPKGLPRDRVAALRAAVRVATLNEAYRAGSTPTDDIATNNSAPLHAALSGVPTHQSPVAEPPRFAPAANATALPTPIGVASTSTVQRDATVRRDAAVQPVAWLSETSSKPAPLRSTPLDATRVQQAQVGNPLRRDSENGAGNPLR